jgi:exonuclease VII large subunit
MERGFSVVLNGRTGKVLRRAEETKPGDRLTIRPLEGIVVAETKETGEA